MLRFRLVAIAAVLVLSAGPLAAQVARPPAPLLGASADAMRGSALEDVLEDRRSAPAFELPASVLKADLAAQARATEAVAAEAMRQARAAVVPAWYASSRATIVVNTLDGGNDGTCGTDGADTIQDCSLLEALALANINGAADEVTFSVTGTITPASTPTITTPVTIDGTANGLEAGDLVIDGLDGGDALVVFSGAASGSVVRGLSLVSAQVGLRIIEASAVWVQGNFIGTNADGADLGNAGNGIDVGNAPSPVIAENTIGFNGANGIVLFGAGTSEAEVSGNFIGTNAAGDPLGNVENGVFVIDAPSATISTNTVGFNNIGISVLGSGSTEAEVLGNFVGTNAAGSPLGNRGNGIRVQDAPSAEVASNTVGLSNTGIAVSGAGSSGAEVTGNFIGTNAAGADLGNAGNGVDIGNAPSPVIAENTIGFNGANGIVLFGAGTSEAEVSGNFIGTNAAGDPLGNVENGVFVIDAPSATISTNTVGFNNIGISVLGSGSTEAEVLGNFVGTNAAGSPLGNRGNGIRVQDAPSAEVASNTVGLSNTGIAVSGAGSSGAEVTGNFIGTNAAGADLGNAGNGVDVGGAASVVVSTNTVGFNAVNGIILFGAESSGAEVSGNFVGTNAAGTPLGNAGNGIRVQDAPSAEVTSNTVGFNNTGIAVSGAGSSEAEVTGNFIGTNAAGADLGNAGNGVDVGGAASVVVSTNTVGFNAVNGIILFGAGTSEAEVSGNFIGTNAAGSPLGNIENGIFVQDAPSATISTNTVGFNRSGVAVSGAGSSEAEITGNYIGTNAGGAPLGNVGNGVDIGGAPSPVIVENTIGFNTVGIVLFGAGTSEAEVSGNFVGTNADGANLGNASSGIAIFGAPSVTVEENTVAFNGGTGIAVTDGATAALIGNAISVNAELGINLGGDGVTANDAGDGDDGPNGLQNYPVIRRAFGTQVAFTLDTQAGDYRIEAFASDEPDDSGFGEGARFLGSTTVTSAGSGPISNTVTTADLEVGEWITLTATRIDAAEPSGFGGTSEFSRAVAVEIPVSFAVVQQAVLEGAGSVDLVIEVEDVPDLPATVTVALVSGDSADLGGFTSATLTIGSPDDSADDQGRYIVTVPVTDDARPEDAETFVFELSVDNDDDTETPLVADRGQTAVVVVDNDGEAVTVTVPADGVVAFAVPVNGLTAAEVAAAASTDTVFVLEGAELVEVDPNAVLFAGQVVVLESDGPIELSGSSPLESLTFEGMAVAEGARVLVGVGNPTGGAVSLADLEVGGGTLADVVLVFDEELGAFRPVSLGGLDNTCNGLSGNDLECAALGAFEVVVVQVVPAGSTSDVSVTLATSEAAADGTSRLTDEPFTPTDGETAVVLALRPTAADDASGTSASRLAATPGDVVALRVGIGIDGLDPFDGADVQSPLGGTLAAVGLVDESALWAALSVGEVSRAQSVTVPLAVAVPEAGRYEIALASMPGQIDGRPVTVELFDGTTPVVLEDGAPFTFEATDADTVAVSGRFAVRISLGVGVSTDDTDLDGVALAVWPNPSAGRATVTLSSSSNSVRVAVYDALGREVAVLHDGAVPAGESRFEVAAGLAPGSYVIRATGEGFAEVLSLTVVR